MIIGNTQSVSIPFLFLFFFHQSSLYPIKKCFYLLVHAVVLYICTYTLCMFVCFIYVCVRYNVCMYMCTYVRMFLSYMCISTAISKRLRRWKRRCKKCQYRERLVISSSSTCTSNSTYPSSNSSLIFSRVESTSRQVLLRNIIFIYNYNVHVLFKKKVSYHI